MQRSRRPREAGTPLPPEAARERALATALRALARAPRSRSEIARTLARRGHAEETIAAVSARLAELGYLDDALVADAVARGAVRKQLGSRRVALTLARRGVARDVVAQAAQASGASDLERARAFVARRFPGGAATGPAERRRAARLLYARGFPGDVVRQALGVDVDVACDDADAAEEEGR
jgi:regulatory protein